MMDRPRTPTAAAIKTLRSASRRQHATGKRLAPMLMSNSPVSDKKFSRKDLEEACRKYTPTKDPSASLRRQHQRKQAKQTKPAVDQDSGSQIKALDEGVKLCARKYNECKAQADRLEGELRGRADEQAILEKEATVLHDMIVGNNPEAKKISKITEEIEKAAKSTEAKLRYRLQLNHMHQRQRKNSVSLDGHMSAMSETLSSARREREQCEKMLGNVESSLSDVMRELEETAREIDIERVERQRSLNSKRAEAKNAERLENWRNERESSRQDLEQSLGGNYKLERDKRLNSIRERQSDLRELNKDMEIKSKTFSTVDESFTHMKQATGVNSLEEMVEKFRNRQEHHDHLLLEKKDAEERLDLAKTSLQMALDTNDRTKANGCGDTELNRGVIDEINLHINKERIQGNVVRSTNVRLEGVLVGLRQGGMGLYQRLLPFHPTLLDGDAPDLNESSTTSAIQAAYDTLEILKFASRILGKMLDAVGGIERIVSQEEAKYEGKESIEKLENPNLGDNNCRIKAKKKSSPRSTANDCCDASGYLGDLTVIDGSDNTGDSTVPSRLSMKSRSEQEAGEARRQVEVKKNKRRKPPKEKAVPADANSTDANEAAELRDIQIEATNRMARHIMPIGLPKSVTLRDDPMTKAQAFLTELPCLE